MFWRWVTVNKKSEKAVTISLSEGIQDKLKQILMSLFMGMWMLLLELQEMYQ